MLEYGAAAWAPLIGSDPGPLREAARADSPEVFRLLLEYGGDLRTVPAVFLRTSCFECAGLAGESGSGPLPRVPPPDRGLRPVFPESSPATAARAVGAASAAPTAVRAAVERSLPLLQRIDIPFIRKTGCVSCHHNSVVSVAVAAAGRGGYRFDDALVAEQRRIIADYLESWRERTLQNIPIAGGVDTVGYLMLGTRAAGQQPDAATDAQAIWLKRRQLPDGHWAVQTIRPPIESNDIEVTAVAMRALQMYGPGTQPEAFRQAVERARDWLAAAKPQAVEEHAFRLLGLSWAGAERGLIEGARANCWPLSEVTAGGRSCPRWPAMPMRPVRRWWRCSTAASGRSTPRFAAESSSCFARSSRTVRGMSGREPSRFRRISRAGSRTAPISGSRRQPPPGRPPRWRRSPAERDVPRRGGERMRVGPPSLTAPALR